MEQLVFELVYEDVAVQQVSHYVAGIPLFHTESHYERFKSQCFSLQSF